ncbi:Ig-like domain-containing protein [Enterobacter hormaechei subsp. hoffmannii]|uniref:Ig-like domain-containing protein n=1 Tax=Enterobacter hormaechei TaxID=158836 RepID=UPI0038C8B87F|nr:Ig-like domain-containing protein [Enterobacter hormaechei]
MSNAKVVDVIIRKTAEKTKLTGEGNLSVSISSPSVIEIQGSAQDVVRYVRQGNDLLIYMKDGSVIRCNNYFVEDTETHNHSELVFNDNQELTHISFANAGEASGVAATELTAQAAPISSIEPFLEQGSVLSDAPWGWIAGAALGGGAIGALLAHGGDGETKTKVIDNTKEVESATPTFLLTDNAGDKQGVLSAKEVTDDNTPTFSGTGQPGATIQVKDSSGSTIASTMVAKDGTWTVTLPTQADGEHTWSVVQIDGSKTTSAGSITVTVSTADTSVTLATTAGDNVINASEQAAGFTLSGTSKNLAQGTALTVTLNGKTYSAEVGANGAWSVKVPAADAQALGDGTWTVNVSGKDAAGNTVTGSQTIGVDTAAPAISVDTIAQDNIINAAEHNQPLTLTGKTDAEAGQIVTVTLNGKNHTATVGSDGTWSVTLSASEVQAMANGEHTLTANVSDKAGNGASTTADFTVDTAAPVVTINTVAGDDILNTSEQGQAQIISGQANGAAAGDVVTVTVGGKTFTGVVQADGSWSVGVPASVIGALGEGSHSISVSVTDAAGNTGSATHGITLSGNPPEFTLDPISQDNVLNALEAMQPLSLSGTSNLPNGSAVTVTLNNVNYQATVENGSWSVQVPVSDVLDLANTLYTVSVSGTDSVGNSGSAEANLLVDTALPQVILNTFAGDNLVNNAEAAVDQTLSGRVTGAAAGDTVSVTVGGKSYTATVGSDLKWSVTIPSADLQAFGDGELTFSASVTNAHGNTGTGERDININAELPGLRVNTISGDDVINAIEQQQDLAVTGSSTHLAEGTQITVTINNVEYVTTVNASGSWQIGVPSADLQAWTAGGMTVSVSAEDAWGNTVAAEHPIELDLNAVAVTIDTVTTDDMLNAAEKGADVTLSGQTQGVEAGQTVVVKFADQTFTAQVQQDGSWRLTVPASAMETLIDGRAQVSVSVTNVNGNSADASRVVTVDTQPPAITLDNLTDDNIINAAEAQQDLVLSGSTTAEAGQTVTVTLNGKSYQTTVQADGRWQLNVPAADVGALTDGNVTVTATVSDVAGNSSSADRVGLVDATVPQVTINDFVTDTNTVNQLAHSQAQILSGSVAGAAAGDLVIITINNVDYTTVVDAAGNWSLGLPASVVQGLTDGTWTINVSVTDRSGNTGSSSVDVVVNTVTPVIGINTLAADDVINTAEKGEDLLLSGTSNQPEGTTITVNLNGINYAATTDASGNWSVSVPASAVSALGEANYTVTASVTDNVGNSASATHDVLVDSSLPVVTLNNVAGDNIVNAAEVAAGQTLTGKVSNAASGDTVTIIIGGQTYTATVQDDLTWSLPLTQSQLTALGNGDLTVSASVTNAHGNTGSSSLDVTIDAQLPGLRIDTVAGDDVINVIEHAQNLVISGTSTDLAAGSTVTVSINGKSYSASVLADGTWQAAVPAADVSRWADGALTISASAQDTSGNPVNIGTVVDVDLAPVAISINSVTDDNVLNAAEKGQDLVLSGSSSNVEAGQTVTIIFAGKTWATMVDANGDWTCTVPAAELSGLKDGDASVQVSVTNMNGNAASSSQAFSVDTAAPAVTINTISGDNMLNAAEAALDLTLSGTSTAEAGQTVTVTFNGNQYTAQVQANGSWTLDVPAADLAGIADGSAAVTATVSDKAGNPASAGASVLVDTTVPQITFNIVAGDDIVNIAEHGQALIVTGKVTGAQAGDVITLTLNGKDYTAMLDGAGNWSVGVPAADVGALANGDQTISATLTDKAGNSTSTTHAFDVSLTAPVIAITTLAVDDVINATERGQDLLVSGTSNQPDGTRITVTLNGISYAATTDASGNWSVTVPAANVSALGEASYSVTASVTDTAGNSANTSHSVLVDSALPQVTINAVATDDVINAAEVASGQTLSGKVSGAASGDTVTIGIGGNTYTATVQDDLSWSVNVASDVLTAIGNGDLTVTASVTNGHGNTGTGERDITIDASLPGLRVDTVAGDDVINSIEHTQNLIITGSSDGLASGSALTVTVNGKTYAATVLADGTWTAAIPAADVGALSAGTVTVTVDGQSAAGNPVSISHDVKVDLAPVAISIDAVATDDVINAAEKGADLVLSGSTTNVEENQTVNIIFGGKTYSATVDASGHWTATVPSADLGGLKDGDTSVQVSVTNVNGNSASAGREYSVDATAPTVSIEIVSDNNIINAAEAQQDLVINGVSDAEAGQTVTVTLNGENYTTTMQANGSWSVTVPSADVGAIADGDYTITAAVQDKAGNPASADRDVLVDTTVPQLTINAVSDDDVINSAEHAQALIVTGSVTGAAAGDVVTVTINNKDYTATLDASGKWNVGVPAADVSALTAGDHTITAALTDKAGNSNSTTHEVEVNLTAPVLTIDTVSGDDVINNTEKTQDLTITGTASGLAAGAVVTVMLNGKAYSATVATNGQWTTTVPASEVGQLGEALYTVSASATDSVGNSTSTSHTVNVESVLPGVIINTVAGDDVINAAELATGQTISGKVVNAEAGNTVTVTIGGNSYTATVQSDLTWSVSVPESVLTALGNGDLTVSASVTNGVGNSVSNTANLLVDTALPTVTINTVAGDNVINAAEVAAGQTLSGRVTNAEAGNTVTVTIGGNSYTATVQSDLTWSVNVPESVLTALGNGDLTVSATVTNDHGNSGTGERDITIDASLPGLRVDTVAGDDVINSIEHGQNLIVTGSSDGLAAGTTLTVTLNGKTYAASVLADGSWTAAIPAADVGALAAGTMTVTVAGQSAAGNPVSISHDVTVDLAAVAISIDAIATDDVINAAEKGADLVLSGSTSNVEENQTVTITFGGRSYTAKVDADGNWTASVPSSDLAGLKDGDASVQVSITNAHGNSASAGREYSVDATAPTVTIDTVAGDNVINGSEAAAGVAISGTTTAEVGQTVTVTFGGNSYTAQVQQGGVWSVNVPGTDLSALADNGYTVQVSVSDAAGNPGSAGKAITLDTTPPTVSFNVVAGDDVINSVEHGQAQIVSGTATGASVGDKLIITIGSNQYTTTVDASGKWSVGVPASVISALADGTVTLSATITDSAGNSSTQTHDVVVNTASVALTVNTLSGDDVINAAEAGASLVINGSSAQFASGTQVTITLNGKSYTATIQSDGAWQTTVPAADVGALADGASYQVSASAQDSAGNSASATHTISVDTTAPVISVNTLSGDDVLNAAEAQQPLTVHGSSSAEAGQTVTVTLGGKTYTALVGSDGTWTLDVPAADLVALSQGALTVTAVVNDKAGNSGQTTHTLTVDTVAPAVTISTVADDDIVNNAEQLAGQTISGTTTAEQGQTVTVSFNGHSYQATVGADGSWSVFVPGRDFLGLSDGDYTITATVSDKAGNPGSATHDVTLNGDVPTIVINTFAQDDIVNAAEHGTPLIVSGTTDAPAGQTVTITLNGKTYTATVQNDGTWSYTVGSADVTALADGGSYVINAQVSNAIGNSASDNHSVTVDLTAPSMGISIDSLQNDTGLSASDFITNDKQVVVNGSLSAQLGNNEKAQISLEGGSTWIDLTVTGTTWRYTDGRTLTDGTYPYQVRVIDNAGNVGATDSQDVVIDLTKPAATSITVDSVSQDTGLSDSDFITSDNQISLKGTLGAALGSGDHAQISLDGGATWTDVSVSGLSWTYVDGRTLADGDYNYQLRVIDDAGNISATTSQVVTIDTVAPDASKTIAIDSISDDTGLSSSDFITNDTSLTLHGSLGATLADGEYAQISIDGGVSWQNVIVTGNSWYYVDGRTLGNQTYDYYVRVVDAAGNVGASAHQQVMVDTVAPDAAITVTVDNITVDTGFDNNDFLTSSTSYTLNGTLGAELGAGEYVQVSMDGGTTWVYATVSGTRWSYNDARTLADGDYRYQVRVVDQAGNVGATTTQDVTVDTQAPQYGITIDSISEDTGQSGSDFITMDTSLTINGSLGSALASDERVQISLDGGNTWIDTAVTNQRWSYTDTRDLADGDYTWQVRIIDQAGNVGSTSSQVVTVDTTPPETVGTVVSYTDGEGERTGTYGASVATDDTSPLINGTLNRAPEDGEIVQLYRDGILLGQVTMNGSASWSYQDNGLLDGNHTYILRVTDKAGNYTESDGFVLNVDTSIPTTTAAITAQTTSDTTPIINGTVSADLVNGEYLVVMVNGKTYTSQTGGAVVVDPDHNTWYLQIPDSDALSVANYDVTAQVKSSAGNGNTTGTATGSLVIDTTSVNTDWATTTGNSNNSTMTVGTNSSGLWNIIANGQSYSSSDSSTYAGNTLSNTRVYYVVSQTAADFDRNGTQDIFATENTYAGSTQVMWTYDGSSYTAGQLAMGTTIWYGGVIAYDKTGDCYLDLAYGDAGMDSLTYLVNTNGVLSPDGTGGEGGFYGQFDSGREISGVDLNNDGTVDIVQHTNRSGAYSLTVINNNGNGTLSIGQNLTNVFVANASNTTTAASMTWADFNGDGYMDLYLGSSYNSNGGVIYYNDGTGQLSTTRSAVEASNATAGYLSVAVDWNGDGQMDIIKLSTYGGSQTATLFTNNGYGSTWTSSQLASGLANVTGVAAVDYNWDGAQDLLVSQQNGKVVLVQNNAEIADGTAMHLHIVDSEGINAYYGNTVNLYNAAGVLVASQIINAQSGIGSNDTSAQVSFYGLDPNETYSAEIVKITNGVSDNVTWTGLDASNGKEGYVLTAEAATGGHSGTITGTGYNDTFIAEDGTYTYNGSGGWNTHSDYDTWSNTGGMDVVDYRNATSGITVDLRLSTAQDTGFGTTRLLNIEGINGSDYDDVITGNSGDNQFEGRGGNDTFNIGSGGQDTLLYKLINASDATGGNGSDVVNGFTVGTWEGTADTDRIDLRDLLSDSGYTGTGSASYVNGVATLDSSAGNIADYIRVVQNGSNTEIQVDLDGTGGQFSPTTLVTLNGVQTDLATLLANHQLLIA